MYRADSGSGSSTTTNAINVESFTFPNNYINEAVKNMNIINTEGFLVICISFRSINIVFVGLLGLHTQIIHIKQKHINFNAYGATSIGFLYREIDFLRAKKKQMV